MKLLKGDEVQIIKGKDAGKKGKIQKTYPKESMVLIPDMNLFKRHMKSKDQRQKSEIITITKPLHSYNVALVCPNCHKLTRVGYKIDNKEKIRICKKCNKKI